MDDSLLKLVSAFAGNTAYRPSVFRRSLLANPVMKCPARNTTYLGYSCKGIPRIHSRGIEL
jgi:hypothetical protein